MKTFGIMLLLHCFPYFPVDVGGCDGAILHPAQSPLSQARRATHPVLDGSKGKVLGPNWEFSSAFTISLLLSGNHGHWKQTGVSFIVWHQHHRWRRLDTNTNSAGTVEPIPNAHRQVCARKRNPNGNLRMEPVGKANVLRSREETERTDALGESESMCGEEIHWTLTPVVSPSRLGRFRDYVGW